MKNSKRVTTKRLRFNAEQASQLESYLAVQGFGFTKLIHDLIKRELYAFWPSVVEPYNAEIHQSLIIAGLKLQKKRSTKNNMSRPVPCADPKLLMELGRIGNNVNQIARSLNFLCLQNTQELEKFSFIDCLDVLATIQSDLYQHLPIIPKYFVSDQLAERRRAKAIARVKQEDR